MLAAAAAAFAASTASSNANNAFGYAADAVNMANNAVAGILGGKGGATIAHRAAVYRDADFDAETMLHQDLWHGQGWPEALDPANLGPSLLDDPDFAFLRRWFFAMAEGKPLPVDLMTRIALEIDQSVWDSGDPAQVAAAIKAIEDDWTAQQAANANRAPEFEPEDVSRLFAYPQSVIASVSMASQTITQNFITFRQETGLNLTPDFLEPLEAIPASLDRIGDILAHQAQSAASEQSLREEIGRLTARVDELERSLAEARRDLELLDKPWFKDIKVLGGAVVTLVGALWVVSADDVDLRQRAENLIEEFDGLTGAKVAEDPTRRLADKR